jgi:hypothetical protein
MKSLERQSRPKAEKKKRGGWHPGMKSKTAKIEAEVEVTARCQCCGDVTHWTVITKIAPNSPRVQKVAISLCWKCPDYIRTLDKEQLVTIILMKEHPDVAIRNNLTPTHIRMSRMYTPEDIVAMGFNNKKGENNGNPTKGTE